MEQSASSTQRLILSHISDGETRELFGRGADEVCEDAVLVESDEDDFFEALDF